MSPLSSLGGLPPPIPLAVGGTLLALLAWLSWRKPTWLLGLAFASLAIRPPLLWGGSALGWDWGVHQSLFSFALLVSGARYGVHRTVPWPILALIAVAALNLLLGELHRDMSVALMLVSLALFALPFAASQIILAPGSRRWLALAIAVTPLLSVALGGLLQAAELRVVFSYERWIGHSYRLEGATGNAAVFGMLAFAGFTVALHEWTRPNRPHAASLAVVNLILVILSGTRMAIFASFVFLGSYAWLSPVLRQQLRQKRSKAGAGTALVALTLLAYGPTLLERMFADDGETLSLSGRAELWSFYWRELLFSPWFGRGLGAGFVAAADWLPSHLPLPHNEYLHLLVVGGVVGFVLVCSAIGLWYRQLLRVASPNDRGFLLALIPALAAYAVTDNVLIYSSALALYAYLGVALTLPSSFASAAPGAWSAERAQAQSP